MRGIYDEPRLSEIAAMYAELGFEVRLEIPDPVSRAGNGCLKCIPAGPSGIRALYTRP